MEPILCDKYDLYGHEVYRTPVTATELQMPTTLKIIASTGFVDNETGLELDPVTHLFIIAIHMLPEELDQLQYATEGSQRLAENVLRLPAPDVLQQLTLVTSSYVSLQDLVTTPSSDNLTLGHTLCNAYDGTFMPTVVKDELQQAGVHRSEAFKSYVSANAALNDKLMASKHYREPATPLSFKGGSAWLTPVGLAYIGDKGQFFFPLAGEKLLKVYAMESGRLKLVDIKDNLDLKLMNLLISSAYSKICLTLYALIEESYTPVVELVEDQSEAVEDVGDSDAEI